MMILDLNLPFFPLMHLRGASWQLLARITPSFPRVWSTHSSSCLFLLFFVPILWLDQSALHSLLCLPGFNASRDPRMLCFYLNSVLEIMWSLDVFTIYVAILILCLINTLDNKYLQ